MFLYVCIAGLDTISQEYDFHSRTCMVCENFYRRTFDGREFTFNGRCNYLLFSWKGKIRVEQAFENCDKNNKCDTVSKEIEF